ncbi:MAG: UDP-N-acetylglucosamine--N-acetylmuramyl-(pentapeptide) pyrophosphoryl-undecaprenol N-acetylglucosamine transferase [Mycobacteriaceae bacterium]|nr:UDP-N-acetylglucosamine--N-acetylmuramyl-(pentapeptide) pyrophosphoryl-undecaprenol N-acetylglucosamine transferase [Mycobacteriaceae bacterium]
MSISGETLSVVLAGGGTAGHVEPALAVADALTALHPGIRITALGTARGLETRLVPDRGYPLELVTAVPLPRRISGDLVRLPWRIGKAVRQTRAVLDRVQADVVVGFGGYVALPAYLAARPATVLLVFGGSQGAVSINRAVSAAAAGLAAAGISVLHAHGPKNTLQLPPVRPGDPPYVAVPYLDRMDLAYAAADLAICRSGAMTVAEVSAVGLPAVYVPLPIGNGEQRLNALPVVRAGGGVLVSDTDLTPGYVANEVVRILADAPRLRSMTAAAARAGHRDAARRVAQVVIEVAGAARADRVRQ